MCILGGSIEERIEGMETSVVWGKSSRTVLNANWGVQLPSEFGFITSREVHCGLQEQGGEAASLSGGDTGWVEGI